MIACLDANVLYPTVARECLLAVARAGLFAPLWSPRILEEWARAMARDGAGPEAEARGEIALLRAGWPGAELGDAPEDGLWLPDPADVHVLACAKAGGADSIVTFNLRDFPARELAPHGITAIHPDAFLMAHFVQDADTVSAAIDTVHGTAERLSGAPQPLRALLKRARLPRLGKALGR